MAELSAALARQLRLTKSSGRQIVRSLDELSGVVNAHALRRAWEGIGLSAILFVDAKPTVYFKEVRRLQETDIRRYHRFVWNQGIATLLVVSTPTDIYVFSGQAPPASREADLSGGNRLVQQLHRVNDALEVEQLLYRIETGTIYEQHAASFDRNQAIDQYLLRNLREVAIQLHEVNPELSLARIDSLLGRTIFVCYLVDRKIIDADFFEEIGVANASSLGEMFDKVSRREAINALYRLFDSLQAKFNGSLFDEDLADEQSKIDSRHIEKLSRFLKGDDLGSGQTTLGFWAYDFNFIPIETISAIYEEFLGVEQQSGLSAAATFQRKSGAYYTPKHLAELVLDTATEDAAEIVDWKILDPACGSGIFLVSLFNRMAEEWRTANLGRKSDTRWKALVKMLQTQLFGIDKNETACRITCFSLYLALLDQFAPRDIQELAEQGKLLPTLLLQESETLDENSPRTILCRNFFDEELPNGLHDFDLIIGNPPWIGRNQPADPVANRWYQDHVNQTLPSGQIAHAFMWKCPQHIEESGRVCLVLPSKVFLNRTDDFQLKWFEHHRIEEVLQLADLSFILFENASCPAVVVRYRMADATEPVYLFDYISPQASRSDPRRGTVVITSDDHKQISSAAVMQFAEQKQAPSLWKMFLRGTPRDVRLLERLMSYPRLSGLVGSPKSSSRWTFGQGFKPGKTDGSEKTPKYPWWKESHPFIDAKRKLGLALSEDECEKIGGRHSILHRLPDRRVFQSPLVLISQGFTKVAYADFDVLFQDSLQSIAGDKEDRELLIFLCAYLRSRLANYFLFHTAANWGTERDKVQKYELMQIPFFTPEHEFAPRNAKKIVNKIHSIFAKAESQLSGDTLVSRDDVVRHADKAMEPLIFEYFDCDQYEQDLIYDTFETIAPSSTPTTLEGDIPTLRPPTHDQRLCYASTICEVLNDWGKRSPIAISARSIASPTTGLGVVILEQHNRDAHLSKCKVTDVEADDQVVEQLSQLRDKLRRNHGMRTYMRGLTVFEGKRIFIVKPLAFRFWSKTSALNDADSLATAILSSKERLAQ